MNNIKSQIRAFIGEQFDTTQLRDEDDIFALGFVNSMFSIRLVLFVEETFEIQLSNDELDLNHFRTINRMEELVTRKLSAKL